MKTKVHLEIKRKLSFADEYSFGKVGPYERLIGTAHFALDPSDVRNSNIIDLNLAPLNGEGLVEFRTDLDIMKPINTDHGNHTILYDVNNRGNRTVLSGFNDAPRVANPVTLDDAGNGFLMRNGYTIVWSGWQGDLIPDGRLFTVDLPEGYLDGKRLNGKVRQEFIAERGGIFSMPLSGSDTIISYEALDPQSAVLTVREREMDPREVIPPGNWDFAEATTDSVTGKMEVIPSNTSLYVRDGFNPGCIYELIYTTQGSKVMGLGIAGIRDLISHLRYDLDQNENIGNSLGIFNNAYMYGASLSARVIRQFVYDGYNVDPENRRVFDAVYPHVSGGGRLFTNARFAQVGRYPRQHEEHQWPSERYPFAYSVTPDPFIETLDSVLKRPDEDPLVMHTHTNTEYWQRHASLGHTNPGNGEDLEIPENVRIYVISSAQHGGSSMPEADVTQQASNSMTTGPILRAALTLMHKWVTQGEAPPISQLPRRDTGTLSWWEDVIGKFPNIPGFRLPDNPSMLPLYDYGPDFDKGLVTEHPPKPIAGREYHLQLPVVDADGNDLAGVRSPEIEAPVGTHTGWNLRKEGFAEGDLFSLSGSFVPFARTKAERESNGDPRLSIEERYPNHLAYIEAVESAARNLVSRSFLLEEDAERYIEAARSRNPLDPDVPLLPLILNTIVVS